MPSRRDVTICVVTTTVRVKPDRVYFSRKRFSRFLTTVEKGDIVSVTSLLKSGLNVNRAVSSRTPLFIAISKKNLAMVNLLIQYGANVNYKIRDLTPVTYASHLSSAEIVATLIANGADLSWKSNDLSTALHYAARSGVTEIVNVLIKKAVDINAVDKRLRTPLHCACELGYFEVVKALVSSGADVECLTRPQYAVSECDEDLSSLCLSVIHDQKEIVQFLIQAGANVNGKSSFKKTALHLAAQLGFVEIVDFLLKSNADVNIRDSKGITPLHEAALHNHPVVIELLLDSNVIEIDARTGENNTALYIAAKSGYLEIARMLLKKKADVNSCCVDGATPLHVAIRGNFVKLSVFLIQNGADVNAVCSGNMTPLHYATLQSSLKIVKALIAKDANVNFKNCSGQSALIFAVKEKQLEITDFLIESKAEINSGSEFHSAVHDGHRGISNPLHIATENNHIEIVKLLLERGAKVNARNEESWSALHIAAMKGHKKVADILLAYGAAINAEFGEGLPALHCAARHGSLEVLKSLVMKGADVNLRSLHGLTPLQEAIRNKHLGIVKYLILSGAYFDSGHDENDATASFIEEFAKIGGRVSKTVKFLLLTENFFQAVKSNCIAKVEDSLKKGAFINTRSIRFRAPLLYAAWKGHLKVVNILLNHRADINISDDRGWCALHYAAKFNRLDVVLALLKQGAIYHRATRDCKMPLELAEEAANDSVVAILRQVSTFFEAARSGNKQIVADLQITKAQSKEKFLAIMNARNEQWQSLPEVCVANNYKSIGRYLCLIKYL